MKYLFFFSLIFLNSCTTFYTRKIPDSYNVASHDTSLNLYSKENSRYYVSNIPANTTFRVAKTTKKSKYGNRRKIIYNRRTYWVTILVFKTEVGYLTKVEGESIQLNNGSEVKQYNQSTTSHYYHTGPRGGQYYINSHGNKTYRKKK